MASTLSGLIRTLAWGDFSHRRGAAPAGGGTAALTFSGVSYGGIGIRPIAHSRPRQFALGDTVLVRVTFSSSASFVMSWVFTRPPQFQVDMLSHEQGHYNITALIARDFFVDVMMLKSQTFATARAGTAAVDAIKRATLNKIRRVQDLYDREVHPEQNSGVSHGPIQQSWDTIIQAAFTRPRVPPTQAPDGTPHKQRLLDVLGQNGKRP